MPKSTLPKPPHDKHFISPAPRDPAPTEAEQKKDHDASPRTNEPETLAQTIQRLVAEDAARNNAPTPGMIMSGALQDSNLLGLF